MDISVVVRGREDASTSEDIVGLAGVADDLGYEELWVGEGPTWDAFVLATAIGLTTRNAALTVGPVAVSVRDPATISRGAASVAAVTGRSVGVALGTASVRVVEKLHGRSRRRPVTDLNESARATRHLIDTRPDRRHLDDPDARFLRRLGVPSGPLTVAAFGDRAIRVAADYADRMVGDLVTSEQVTVLKSKLDAAADSKVPPRLAAWLPTAVEPSVEALRQVKESIAGYLTIAGYREMFLAAGFDEAVARAADRADLDELVAALPDDAPARVGPVGSRSDVEEALGAYAAAGLDEMAIVPATAGDRNGERTLRAVRSLL